VSKYDGTTWAKYTTAQGLANNSVKAVAAAPNGDLWFGTAGGVNKYNGSSWTTYLIAQGLGENDTASIDVASDGTVWAGHTGSGVSKFTGSTPWTVYTTSNGLANNNVNGIDTEGTTVVWFATGGGGVSKLEIAAVNPPVADFSGSPTSGNAPLTVNFTDSSTNTPTSWSWTFGDSGTSTAQNPSHQYTSAGTYTVSLTATNAGGSDIETKTNYITVTAPADPNFSGTPRSGSAPLLVTFTDLSTGEIDTWKWTFGDGGTLNYSSPPSQITHTYETGGTYTVELKVRDENNGQYYTETKVDYITVTSPVPPTAAFVGSPTSGGFPLTVNFTDQSTGSISAWSWTFGDGGTSAAQNPAHIYQAAGNYTVSLTVSGPVGNDTETRVDYIIVTAPPAPVAAFSGSPTSGEKPLTVDFTDQSTGSVTAWSWTFGDGGTSTAQNPSHVYNNTGVYTVSLTATNVVGSDIETKSNYITVTGPQYEEVWTTYNNSNTGGAIGNNTINGAAAESGGVRWFGTNGGGLAKYDGTTWTKYTTGNSGLANNTVYAIAFDGSGNKWIATNVGVNKYTGTSWTKYTSGNSGLANNNTRSIAVDNSGDVWVCTLSSGICKFNGTSWTQYKTTNSGIAANAVRGVAVDSSNNKWIATSGGVSKYDGTTWTNYGKPPLVHLDTKAVAVVSGNIWVATLGGVNKFNGSSWVTYTATDGLAENDSLAIAGDSDGVVWVGSNGSGSSKFAGASWTKYNTSNSGLVNNTVKAVAAESSTKVWFGTSSGVSLRELVTVGPTAAFSGTPTIGEAPLQVNFTDLSMGEISSWSWTFGDSGTSTAQNPSHTYNAVGSYTVSLTVTGSGGSDTETKTNYIIVHGPTPAYLQRVNAGGDTYVDVSGRQWDADKAYSSGSWGYVSGEIGFSNDPISNTDDTPLYQTDRNRNFSYKFDVPIGFYDITLCFAELSHTREGMRVFDVKMEGTVVLDNYDIYAEVGHDVATSKVFSSVYVTDGQLNIEFVPVKDRAKVSAIWVRATGTPVADFNASPTSGWEPLTVAFTDTSTGSVTGWSWDFGDSGTSTAENPTHIYSSQGQYTVSLTVTGPSGSDMVRKVKYIDVLGPPLGHLEPNSLSFALYQGYSGIDYSLLTNDGDADLTYEVNSIDVAWLSVSPTSGTLTPDGYQWLNVIANATGLEAGSHHGHINFATNNPVNPTLTLEVNLTVSYALPIAHFSASPTLGRSPLEVDFTDQSTAGGTVTGWSWTFGDSGTSTAQNPSHIYQSVGSYTVSLTVTGPGGSDTETKENYIEVSNAVAVLEPNSLIFNLASGDIADQNALLSNTGTSDLKFSMQSMVYQTGMQGMGGEGGGGMAVSAALDVSDKKVKDKPNTPPGEDEMFGHEHSPNRLKVKIKADALKDGLLASTFSEAGMKQKRNLTKECKKLAGFSTSDWVLLESEGNIDLKNARRKLLKDPAVEYVEPDYVVNILQTIPNDQYFDLLWGMHNTGQSSGKVDADIDAPEAWDTHTGGDNVLVGVIDTGILYTHPDLADNMWTNPGEIPANGIDDDGNGYIDDVHGYDFYNNDSNPMDDHFHGSHCSGTIAGRGDNSIGIAGVCWRAKLVAMKFLSGGGSGYTSDAVRAVNYANAMGISITSNSWGGGGFDQALKDAIDAAGAKGYLFVAAAGNSGLNADVYPMYPAAYTSANIISVAATDRNDQRASFSNYGKVSVDLGAPGVDVYSCNLGNGYRYASGTSMATPHVAGAATLLKSYSPTLTGSDIKTALLDSVDPIAALQGITVTGGRLNIYKALQEIERWLSMSPTSGTIAPSGSQTLVVTADANGLVAGTYEATITLKTNDPNNTLPTIDVTMNVSGIKRLSASPGTCNFGEVRVGTNASINVTLKNIGSDATTVGSININNAAFTHSATLPMTVPGFSSGSFQLTFSPIDVGYDSGTMTINSDANDNPVLTVYLNGEGKTVVAAFSGAPKSGSPPLAVNFTDLSSGTVTAWSWTFGDSGTSTAQNPSHTYQAIGNYTVTLGVSGPNGSDTEVKSDYISVR
jgi:PKD repeat protein